MIVLYLADVLMLSASHCKKYVTFKSWVEATTFVYKDAHINSKVIMVDEIKKRCPLNYPPKCSRYYLLS